MTCSIERDDTKLLIILSLNEYMKIDKSSFDKIFETRFWQKLKESLVPFDNTPNKSEFLNELYAEITSFTYSPSNPRDYIVINKHNGISRYVPTFSRKDYCVYFLCIKLTLLHGSMTA